MILGSARPYGTMLHAGTPTKLKGAVILQGMGQWPYWAEFWSTWDWTTIRRTIDNLATLGINCLQVTTDGLSDGGYTFPSTTTMASEIGELCSYALSKGMVLNPQLGYQPAVTFASGLSAATNAAVAMAKIWATQPNVAFIDAMNEVNLSPPSSWTSVPAAVADMSIFCSAIRAVIGPIPLTISHACDQLSQITDAWAQGMAPLVDFHDMHTYYQAERAAPAPEDFAGLRSASWYRGCFVVGETGSSRNMYSAAQQTAWLIGNAAVANGLSDCLGSILWGATDTSGAGGITAGYGLLDSTGTTFNTGLHTGIQTWPAQL